MRQPILLARIHSGCFVLCFNNFSPIAKKGFQNDKSECVHLLYPAAGAVVILQFLKCIFPNNSRARSAADHDNAVRNFMNEFALCIHWIVGNCVCLLWINRMLKRLIRKINGNKVIKTLWSNAQIEWKPKNDALNFNS